MEPTDNKIQPKELRDFGLIMAAGLIGLFGLLFPWWGERPIQLFSWPWLVGTTFAAAGIIVPQSLSPLYRIWMKIGHVLGWINSRIILGFVFFVLFMPVSIFFRLTGKDPMARKLEKTAMTYRVKSKQPKSENLEKPF